MKKKFDLLIFIFLLLSPIIDVLTGLQARYNIPFSIGVIVRGIILLLCLIYLYKNKQNRKIIYLFLLFSIIESLYFHFYLDKNIITEIKNIIIIFYLPLMILFFSSYKNKKIDSKLMLKINVLYLLFVVIPYFIGLGFNTYSGEDGKSSYLGLFLDGNELSALLLLLFIVSVNYLLKMKNYSYLIALALLHILAALIIGTKVLLLGTFITFIYFAYMIFKKLDKKMKSRLIIGFITFGVFFIIVLPFTPVYKNLCISLEYYNVTKLSDAFKYKFIDNIIFSKRLSFAKDVFNIYSSSFVKILFGASRSAIMLVKDVEIDILDILFSIGVYGLIIYLYSFNNKVLDLKGVYKFTFILLLLISLFSGHVLIKPMVATYLAVLFILNKEKTYK